MEQLKYNQWKNTDNVIEWFETITSKQNCAFIQIDIKEFYLSITEAMLKTKINFAKSNSNTNNF